MIREYILSNFTNDRIIKTVKIGITINHLEDVAFNVSTYMNKERRSVMTAFSFYKGHVISRRYDMSWNYGFI